MHLALNAHNWLSCSSQVFLLTPLFLWTLDLLSARKSLALNPQLALDKNLGFLLLALRTQVTPSQLSAHSSHSLDS